MSAVTVLGMLSGTSIDAIDTALVRFTRDVDDPTLLHAQVLAVDEQPWPADLRRDLLAALPPGSVGPAELLRLHTRAGDAFGAAAAHALRRAGHSTGGSPGTRAGDGSGPRVDLIVSHGQTIFHGVDQTGTAWGTLQIGDPTRVAAATATPVLADLRAADIAAGGQGAPLVPLLDQLVLGDQPTAVLNIGGISNVSIVGTGDVIAGDTGPGNALLDAAVHRASGGRDHIDRDGRLARAGRVDQVLLDRLLADPYYALPFPRSTGKELFTAGYVDTLAPGHGLSLEDLAATLTELTARTIADAITRLGADRGLTRVVGSGGGMRNRVLRERLAELLDPLPLVDADAVGLPSDAKEAILMALIGWMSAQRLPGVPARADGTAVTGAVRPVILGSLTPEPSGIAPLTWRDGRGPVRRAVVRGPANQEDA